MMYSNLTVLAQMGSTMLGRWFWWPLVVYPRGDNHFLPPEPVPATAP